MAGPDSSSNPDAPAARRRGAPFDGRRFHNAEPTPDRGLRDVLKWMRSRQRTPWPARVATGAEPDLTAPPPGRVAITFINHASFLIRTATTTLVTDPVFAERASPVPWAGPRRVCPPGVPLDRLPRPDLVLLSHNHYDHMDLATLRQLDAPILTTLGNRAYLRARGLTKVDELDWWETRQVGAHGRVTATPAQHFAARTPFDRNCTLWAGFMWNTGDQRLFFAGDTGYAAHFREIRARCGAPDVAFLPIGAYEPRWFMEPVHMDPADAVRAHRDVGAARSIGMHFGCFQLTDEGIDDPVRQLAQERAAAGLTAEAFVTLEVGQTIQV